MKRNIVRMVWSSAEGCFALLLLLMFTRVQEGQAITTGNTVDICTTCHVNATCDKKTDGSGGMVCNCKYGFLGNGRTQCHDKDECQIGATDICGEHTACYNTYGSFYCTCLDGYSPSNRMASFIPNDGTYCDDIDECQVSGICREGGLCKNLPGAFNCTCAEGYTVTNASEPFNPVKDAAFCKAVDCGPPPIIPHAYLLSETGTSYGNVVKYSCFQRYVLKSGNDTTVCNAGGEWEEPSLVCEDIDECQVRGICGEGGLCKNLPGDFNCTCAEGYTVTNESEPFNPVKDAAFCKEINCGIPPPVQYTDMLWDNTSQLGSVVYYKCKEGFYTEEGKNYSVCTANRRWENITLKCKELDCGSPPVLAYTEMLQPNTTSPGSVVYYQCIDGFTSKGGRNVSVCTKRGEWDAATLICKEIPAISELSFKEGCLKWRAHRDDRLKETYNFKLDGLRGYQKDFLDKRIINFTSGDDTPEICLNLQPGTNYTINITALSAGYSIRASITTSITDPPVPQVAFIVAEGPLPPLRLLRAAETNGPISLYQVVVLPMDGPLVFNCSSLNMPNFYSKKGGGGAYVTAELYAEDIADELVFNVGDRQYYGDYYNAPLEEGRGYNIILRVVSEWCQVRKQSCVNWAQTKGLSHTIQHVTILAGGSVGVIGFILFLGFSIVWCCKKRRDT